MLRKFVFLNVAHAHVPLRSSRCLAKGSRVNFIAWIHLNDVHCGDTPLKKILSVQCYAKCQVSGWYYSTDISLTLPELENQVGISKI